MKHSDKEKDQEIIFGIVSPVGTDNKLVIDSLKQSLGEVRYNPIEIKLSDFLKTINPLTPVYDKNNQYSRIDTLMKRGDALREKIDCGGVLADASILEIMKKRKKESGDRTKQIPRTAYILNSLKHPDEVNSLRRTYGKSFWLLSCYSPKETRKKWLIQEMERTNYEGNDENAAKDLLTRDEKESGIFGQNVQKTFPLADVFIDSKLEDLDLSMKRFVKLIFGYPYIGSTIDEYGMFLAQASAKVSLSLARQVGASILTNRGEVMATGTNEVPNKNGGICSEDNDKDKTEWGQGFDYNTRYRNLILSDLLQKLKDNNWLSSEKQKDVKELMVDFMNDEKLKKTQLFDITEFSRETHAEMTALLEASRKSISIKDCFLYCTTFPCHICAKHIITSGLKKVFYIEPYPKSKAEELFSDFIAVDKQETNDLIVFNPFVGIAPRRFMDIFSWGERKKDDGSLLDWNQTEANPRFSDDPTAIKNRERNQVGWLVQDMSKSGLKWK